MRDANDQAVSRRTFVRTAAVTAGAVVTAGGLIGACDDSTAPMEHAHTPPQSARPGGGAVTRNPLRIPGVVSPAGLTLATGMANVSLGGTRNTNAWTYLSQFPAPSIVASRGDRATILLQNGLSQPSITHWHGLLVDHMNDGHPHQAVPAGGSYSYDFVIDQRAALNFYHPHPHKLTGEQVYRGMAGAFIVRDAVDTGTAANPLGLPTGAREIPLIVRDASFDSAGNLTFGNKASGFWGKLPLVNGTLDPVLAVDAGVYRFRLLNGANARLFRFAMSNGAPFVIIGNDGGLLPAAVSVSEFTAAPGERFDLIVDFTGLVAGQKVMLRDLDARWDILEFAGTGVAAGGSVPSGTLSSIESLASPVRQRTFSFDGMTRINGKVYDMDAVEFQVPFGETEEWIFSTSGNGPHPVHVHGAVFQVQSRTGGRNLTYPWEGGWKDTVLLNDGETIRVLIRFTAHRGLYVLHCHQLAHEDAGMMANFEVV